jgi:hypothetical protein
MKCPLDAYADLLRPTVQRPAGPEAGAEPGEVNDCRPSRSNGSQALMDQRAFVEACLAAWPLHHFLGGAGLRNFDLFLPNFPGHISLPPCTRNLVGRSEKAHVPKSRQRWPWWIGHLSPFISSGSLELSEASAAPIRSVMTALSAVTPITLACDRGHWSILAR